MGQLGLLAAAVGSLMFGGGLAWQAYQGKSDKEGTPMSSTEKTTVSVISVLLFLIAIFLTTIAFVPDTILPAIGFK